MPTHTFEKLKPHKQARIIAALIREFARYDFHDASVDRIAADADVAKGSFYQYFAEKEEMFAFALLQATETYRQALIGAIASVRDFPEAVTELTRSHMNFLSRHPHEAGLLNSGSHPAATAICNQYRHLFCETEEAGEDDEELEELIDSPARSVRREIFYKLLDRYCRHLSQPEREFLSFVLNDGFGACETYLQVRGKFVLQDYMHDKEPELPLPKAQTDLLAYMMSGACTMMATK